MNTTSSLLSIRSVNLYTISCINFMHQKQQIRARQILVFADIFENITTRTPMQVDKIKLFMTWQDLSKYMA